MKFTPEDFQDLCAHWQHAAEQSARIANAKLEQWLKGAPRVYRSDDYNYPQWVYTAAVGDSVSKTVTHQAKLVCIEEIKP